MKNSIRSLVAVLSFISLGSVANSIAEEHDHDHDHAKETPKKSALKPVNSKMVEAQKKKVPSKEEDDDHDGHAENGEKSEEGHAHKDEKKHGDEKHSEHGEEKHEDHGDEHGSEHTEESASASVGPTKGILSASDETGFQLSPEALKSFEIRSEKILNGTLSLAKGSIVHSGESVALFRLREGFFKKVPVKIIKRTDDKIQVKVTDFKAGDEVVTRGAAFLRIAELDAAGGIGHGHSH